MSFPSFHFVCVFLEMEKIFQRRWGGACLIVDAAYTGAGKAFEMVRGAENPKRPRPFPPRLLTSFPDYREVSR